MNEPLSTESYKGVRDFYPGDWARMTHVFNKTREVLEGRGYEEYQASPLEPAALYESKGNEEIINEQTYTFEDRGGRRVTLRPEMTPTLARMVAGKRRELTFPLRWYSIGNRFRYERPQKGRLREFFQTDVDLLGLPAGEADLEIVSLASEILRSFGAQDTDFAIRINSRALLGAACRAVGLTDAEAAREYWRLADRKAKMSAEAFEEERKKFKGDPLAAIDEATDPDVKREKEYVMGVVDALTARGLTNVSFDPEIVRGFDYYTGIVFEVNDTSPENPRALFGGGRYDGLVAMFGGDPIPGVGFAFGDVTMMDFLETHELMPEKVQRTQVYVATPSAGDTAGAQEFAATLRAAGYRTFVNLTDKNLSDQLREVNKRGIPLVITYGEEERTSGTVKIKDMRSGEETESSSPSTDIGRLLSN